MDLECPDEELERLSETGLLALNLNEMHAIQGHYRRADIQSARQAVGIVANAPTDVELECLAQTWSEHCKHKIFASKIHHVDRETGEDTVVDSIFKTHIMKPTHDMQNEVDWLLSVFHDNSGVIAWDDEWSVCMKAETHNSPSALDPYGGAMTGIVGVNRDILGTGLGARPIANTDVFCFGPPDWEGDLPENLFHPLVCFEAFMLVYGWAVMNRASRPSTERSCLMTDTSANHSSIAEPLASCHAPFQMAAHLTSKHLLQAISCTWWADALVTTASTAQPFLLSN